MKRFPFRDTLNAKVVVRSVFAFEERINPKIWAKINAQEPKKSTSGWRASLKKRLCLSAYPVLEITEHYTFVGNCPPTPPLSLEKWWWNIVVEQWKSDCGTVWWNSGKVIVEQCGGTVEQWWWNCVVEQWKSDGGIVWCKSATVMVEQCRETFWPKWAVSVNFGLGEG